MEDSKTIKMCTYAVCPRNPGAGAFGYVIRYKEKAKGSHILVPKTIEFSQGFWLSTENRLKIMAAISGFDDIINGFKDNTFENIEQVELFSNSKYFCNAICHGCLRSWSQNSWTFSFKGSAPKPVKNQDLWEELLKLMDDFSAMGVVINTYLIENNEIHEFHDRAQQLAITALTGDYGAYVSDTYYEKNNDLNASKSYYTYGH